jgi:diguanylate cyclase (GGDEF)-like protein/PAS domain S-box-containing protein
LDLKALSGEPWARFVGLCVALTLLYYLPVSAPIFHVACYTTVGLASLGAIAVGIRRRTANPWAWIWIGLGLFFYFIGDLIFNYYRIFLGVSHPFPSVADAFFLLARFPLIAGLIQITRRAGGRDSAFSLLDTLIVASGLSLLWWAFLMAPDAYNTSFSPLERFIAVAYPATDFLLLATGIRLAFSSVKRSPATLMLGGALAALLAADVLYSLLQLAGVFQVGTWIDLGWIWFYAFLGAVALYPESDVKPKRPNLSSRYLALRFGLLTLAALLLPVTIAISRIIPDRLDWATVVLGTVLIVLVMLRLQRLMQQNLALQNEVALWKSDMLFKSIVNRAYSGVSVLSADLTASYASPRMQELTDLKPEESLLPLMHPDDLPKFRPFWQDTMKPERSIPSVEYRLRDPAGHWRDVESTSNNLLSDEWIHGVVLITQDISARKRYERELKRLAYHDALTGLPNRAALADRLEKAVAAAAKDDRVVAAAFFDLDNFKEINDSLGHAVGDRVLVELAHRLTRLSGEHSLAARFGGDEFVLITEHLRQTEDAQLDYTERLVRIFDRPVLVDPYELHLTACVGIALSPSGRVPGHELLDNASVALNQAKHQGQGLIRIFSDDLLELSKRRRALSAALHDILSRPAGGEPLELRLQPIHSLGGGGIVAAEAVPRWHHEEFGTIGQHELQTLAYETDLLAELESRTLTQSCELLHRWLADLAGQPFRLHVNISAVSYQAPHYDRVVMDTLRVAEVRPSRLSLELGETALRANSAVAVAALGPLSDEGVSIVIDDFDRSGATFSQIQQLPHAALKINAATTLAAAEPEIAVMLGGIVAIAHKLGRTVIADGIETEAQAERLRRLGCDLGQGSLFGHDLTPADLVRRLRLGSEKGPSRAPS